MKRFLTLLCALLLVTSLSAQRSQCIAVFEFEAGASIKIEDVKGISSIFITYFQPEGYTLVDRTEIDKIISEQHLQYSQITESQKTQLEKVHNISKMVFGTINITNGEYNVDVKVVDVTRSDVVATDGCNIPLKSSYRESIKRLATSLANKVEALPINDNDVRERSEVEVVLNYLKVYPTELGLYSYEPTAVIKQINYQHLYDYDTWRIPTTEELDLLRNNGYIREETYITSSAPKSEGIVLLVTDATETYSEKQARLAQEAETRNAQKRRAKTEPTFVNDTYPEDKTSEPEDTNTLRSIIKGSDKKFTIMGDLDFAVGGDGIVLGSPFVMAGTTFNDRVFLGAGTGFIVDYDNDIDLPIYFNTRVYFTKNTFVRPFITASIGAELIDMGIYFNPAVGVEIPYSKKVGIYLSAGLELKEDYLRYGLDYYGAARYRYDPNPLFSIKLGLVF